MREIMRVLVAILLVFSIPAVAAADMVQVLNVSPGASFSMSYIYKGASMTSAAGQINILWNGVSTWPYCVDLEHGATGAGPTTRPKSARRPPSSTVAWLLRSSRPMSSMVPQAPSETRRRQACSRPSGRRCTARATRSRRQTRPSMTGRTGTWAICLPLPVLRAQATFSWISTILSASPVRQKIRT